MTRRLAHAARGVLVARRLLGTLHIAGGHVGRVLLAAALLELVGMPHRGVLARGLGLASLGDHTRPGLHASNVVIQCFCRDVTAQRAARVLEVLREEGVSLRTGGVAERLQRVPELMARLHLPLQARGMEPRLIHSCRAIRELRVARGHVADVKVDLGLVSSVACQHLCHDGLFQRSPDLQDGRLAVRAAQLALGGTVREIPGLQQQALCPAARQSRVEALHGKALVLEQQVVGGKVASERCGAAVGSDAAHAQRGGRQGQGSQAPKAEETEQEGRSVGAGHRCGGGGTC
mmetsp:Transcript_16710/g.45932  ORF Transcript_16710/g.45932 Transcript_16710/m.45932 type:complete len:290 (-) Transcript_16710:36-905(-)